MGTGLGLGEADGFMGGMMVFGRPTGLGRQSVLGRPTGFGRQTGYVGAARGGGGCGGGGGGAAFLLLDSFFLFVTSLARHLASRTRAGVIGRGCALGLIIVRGLGRHGLAREKFRENSRALQAHHHHVVVVVIIVHGFLQVWVGEVWDVFRWRLQFLPWTWTSFSDDMASGAGAGAGAGGLRLVRRDCCSEQNTFGCTTSCHDCCCF